MSFAYFLYRLIQVRIGHIVGGIFPNQFSTCLVEFAVEEDGVVVRAEVHVERDGINVDAVRAVLVSSPSKTGPDKSLDWAGSA